MPKNAPHDIESEQALLAALMMERGIYKQVDVSIDDFYDTNHQKMYQCICELIEDGIEPEYVTVSAKIKSKGWDGTVPPTYICGLADKIPGALTKNWRNYVSIIKKKSAARKLRDMALHLQKISQNGLDDLSGKIALAISQLGEIKDKAENKSRSVMDRVRDWVTNTSGYFWVTDCYRDLGAVTERDKNAVKQAINRLYKGDVIIPCGGKNGCYRTIENDAPVINFKEIRKSDPFNIKWPFSLENYVHVFPGNVVLVSGARNAGKTAFLLNTVRKNMANHKIEYFSSEMDEDEFFIRLSAFDDINIKDWKFTARKRSGSFEDVIVPDAINIIDYLDINDEFYKVGGMIKDIWNKLKKGIAIIGLQKPKGRDTGLGGEMSLDKPRLALAIDSGKIKIVKGKIWASDVNPDGLEWEYKLVGGCKYIETGGTIYKL